MATSNVNNSSSSIVDQLNAQNNRSGSTSKAEDQQTRFLKLLTTQLKNQDPLNPMDNAQMTSQLAQISTVDGIERLNATLSSMMSSTNAQQALQAAALVGHGALVAGSNLSLTESGAIGGYDLASSADRVKVEIKDGNGNIVRTITSEGKDAGVQNFVWDGKDSDGKALGAGTYSFSVTAIQGNSDVKVTPLQFGYISGVVRNASTGDLGIDVGNYGRFKFDDLKQII
ncbi:MAG: flagellar hook assembly protein FlgD [Rhodocyclaceae bacterium]|nr:flagellar hook assembly protein FlgD [Rhodocyclaceae bacterium]